jgi:predicted nucleic acid-binding protein
VILADTTVWIDHFRNVDLRLDMLLESSEIVVHPFVIGELSMGSLRERDIVLGRLRRLVSLMPARHSAVMQMVETRQLYGTGLQYIDVHLLASTLATAGCKIWTRDKRLHAVAERLGVAA